MKKMLTGYVVSNKMEKTVVVRVERKFRHPKYLKVVKTHKKYKAHYENIDLAEGDKVVIASTAPISRHKSFMVIKKIS
ncbi:MAG: 30S ribosomal protein S17 [Patescibacteria group bacterium]|nr:30S ribosomal protein S17 [Patescibacteria group bacterium]